MAEINTPTSTTSLNAVTAAAVTEAHAAAASALQRNWQVAGAAMLGAAETISRAIQDMGEDLAELMAGPVAALEVVQQSNAEIIESVLRASQLVIKDLLTPTTPSVYVALQLVYGRLYSEAVKAAGGAMLDSLARATGSTQRPNDPLAGEQRQLHQARQGNLLLVDDEPDLARVAGEFLRRAGFSVTTVTGGNEALAQLSRGIKFDGLITDHAMPGMKGADLILQVRELRYQMPALIITGYAGAEGLHALPSDVAILRKPFHREELVQKVRTMIKLPMAAPSNLYR